MTMKRRLFRKSGGDACSASSCHNARYKYGCEELSFFRFPADDDRSRAWVRNSGRQDLLGKTAAELNKGEYLLCSLHFEPSQFTVPEEKKRLNWNAVPTLFREPSVLPKGTGGRPGWRGILCEKPPVRKRRSLQTGQYVDHKLQTKRTKMKRAVDGESISLKDGVAIKQEPPWSMKVEPQDPATVYGTGQSMADHWPESPPSLTTGCVCQRCGTAFVLVSSLELHLALCHGEPLPFEWTEPPGLVSWTASAF